MIPVNRNYKFENLNLDDGVTERWEGEGDNRRKITKRYRREPQAHGGMKELVDIVAGLQKDVKRINKCLTLDGAKDYIAKNKKKNWQASELDFTGPNGKPDGINEVIVTDANGNIRIINGYTLAKSTYPQRKLYRTIYPTKEARQGHKYGEFLDEIYKIGDELNEDLNPYYVNDYTQYGEQFANIQPEFTPKIIFKKFVFDPTYNQVKDEIKGIGLPPIALAQIATRALSRAYKDMVKDPVLAFLLNCNVAQLAGVADKTKNKYMRSEKFKTESIGCVSEMIKSQEKISEAAEKIGTEYLPEAVTTVQTRYHQEPTNPRYENIHIQSPTPRRRAAQQESP